MSQEVCLDRWADDGGSWLREVEIPDSQAEQRGGQERGLSDAEE